MKVLTGKSAIDRERSASVARRVVSEKLRYPKCGGCGEEVTFWLPPEPPEPDAHGRAMTWAKKCESCGALVTALLEERRPAADVQIVGDYEPFLAENFGHEPVMVQSRQHFRALLREHGLRTPHESG